jgi:hypothetical protein
MNHLRFSGDALKQSIARLGKVLCKPVAAVREVYPIEKQEQASFAG